MTPDIERQELEEGAAPQPLLAPFVSMTGTASQVEWAQRIRIQVDAEFDRVAALFRVAAVQQTSDRRADTQAVIAILEEKRVEVMSRNEAGYFIHDWQEISDQVRKLIFRDPRFQWIKSNRAAGRRRLNQTNVEELTAS